MSGRREPQVHEAARLMGQTSYIYEAGCAFAIDGETTLMTGEMEPDEDGTIYEQIEARGIPQALFEHFEGRLEYHAPWHHGRVLSHLFRGKVDVDEANALLGEHGDDDLRLLDNGAIGRAMPAVEGPTHAYHLVPRMVSKARRRRRPRPRPRLRPGRLHRGRRLGRGPRGRRRGRPLLRRRQRPRARPRPARRARRLGQRHGHRGQHGRRLLRGGRLDPGRAPLAPGRVPARRRGSSPSAPQSGRYWAAARSASGSCPGRYRQADVAQLAQPLQRARLRLDGRRRRTAGASSSKRRRPRGRRRRRS